MILQLVKRDEEGMIEINQNSLKRKNSNVGVRNISLVSIILQF